MTAQNPNWFRQHWQVLAFTGVAIIGTGLAVGGGCYYGSANSNTTETKKASSSKKDIGSMIRMYEKEGRIGSDGVPCTVYKFKPTIKMSEIELEVEDNAVIFFETQMLPKGQKAYRPEIGDRGFTGYETMQYLGRMNRLQGDKDLKRVTLEELTGLHKKIFDVANGDEEKVREILDLDLDASYFDMLANDEQLYAQALKARDVLQHGVQERCGLSQRAWQARNEHQARAYRSELARNREYNAAVARWQRARAR